MSTKSFSIKLNNVIKSYNKAISVDSDKSISIRSFLIGSISNNISKVKNYATNSQKFSLRSQKEGATYL